MTIFYPAFCVALTILFSCGCSQGEGPPVDNGEVLFEGSFPNDANERDPLSRRDATVALVETHGEVIGTVESRNRNLELVFKTRTREDKFLYRVHDFEWVTKITFDSEESLLRMYYRTCPLGLRNSYYVIEFNVRTFKVQTRLISRGDWIL